MKKLIALAAMLLGLSMLAAPAPPSTAAPVLKSPTACQVFAQNFVCVDSNADANGLNHIFLGCQYPANLKADKQVNGTFLSITVANPVTGHVEYFWDAGGAQADINVGCQRTVLGPGAIATTRNCYRINWGGNLRLKNGSTPSFLIQTDQGPGC